MTASSCITVIERLAHAPALLIVCEFDGTIAEYVAQPSAARPVDGSLDALTRLAALPHTRVAVISGRSLQSLRAVCAAGSGEWAACGVELIGSAGMEFESQMTLGLTAEARRVRRLLLQAAERVADAHPGVTVDEKPFGVALHVRGVESTDAQRAIDCMLEFTQTLTQPVYSQFRGHVLDLAVIPVGQDWAIDALREQQHATVLYAGNDEVALASLTPADVGCSVGPRCGSSTISVDGPPRLVALLDCIGRLRAQI